MLPLSAGAGFALGEVALIGLLYVFALRRLQGRYALLIVGNIAAITYLVWRLTSTLVLTGPAIAFSVLLLAVECLGVAQQLLFGFFMARPFRRPEEDWPADDPLPTVDVFVATYDESLVILRRTLTACAQLHYPKDRLNVYVLDDGNRESVRQLSAHLGLHYIARPTHEHAKAGNLNYALDRTDGSLLFLLDADMVPKSSALHRMIGYFRDPLMGFVQAPQAFFNPDAFQHNLALHRAIPTEQDYFMRDMLAARDRFDAVMFVGSNAMFSRKALRCVGGFSQGSITEDVPTGALVQAGGFRSAFVNDVVATGLSAESFAQLLQQRIRWARGYIQAWRQHRPLRLKGLSVPQKLSYLSGLLYWYSGVQKVAYTLAPLLFLNLGIMSLHATVPQLMVFWLPAFLSATLSFRMLGGRRRTPIWSHVYEVAVMCPLAWAVLAETAHLSLAKFRVTQKGLVTQRHAVVHTAFWPLACLSTLSVTGIVHALLILQGHHSAATVSFIAVNLVWAAYNLFGLVMGLLISIDRPRPRQTERFAVRLPVSVEAVGSSWIGQTVDLSETGVRVSGLPDDFSPDVPGLTIHLPGALSVAATCLSRSDGPRGGTLAFRFVNVTEDQYADLVRLIFDRPEGLDDARIGPAPALVRGVARSALGLSRAGASSAPARLPEREPAAVGQVDLVGS